MGDAARTAIAVADPIYRQGLERVLTSAGFEAVALMGSPHQLLCADVHASDPALIVIDLGHDMSGVQADVSALRQWYPGSRVVVVAEPGCEPSFIHALRAGVDGLLVKPLGCEALVKALELVMLGERIFPAEFIRGLSNDVAPTFPAPVVTQALGQLSARELDVLKQLSSGSPNKLIARQFGITEATVKVHVKAILRKLGVRNRTQAALCARRHDLSTPDEDAGSPWLAGAAAKAGVRAVPDVCE